MGNIVVSKGDESEESKKKLIEIIKKENDIKKLDDHFNIYHENIEIYFEN